MSDFKLVESGEFKPLIREMRHSKSFTREEFKQHGLIHPGMDRQDIVNSFRQLRTTLLSKMEKFNSCILVSSVVSGGGASHISMNLAAAFTFDHQKTAMLIDCNFDNPVLADRFGLEYECGLQEYLTEEIEDISSIVYPTGAPRLRLVPCGRQKTDVIEFFTGEKINHFLDEVRNRYPDRIIILDTPPILDSADTKILAEYCDHVLLVVPYKGVMNSTINKTLASIEKSKVIGMVLNK